MDYEKLYKDTITKLQEMVNSGKITAEIACGICADFVPESEDERIKNVFRELGENYLFWGKLGLTKEKAIAWLEKQGEQKPQRMVSAEAKEAMYNKSAWSEEDEKQARQIERIVHDDGCTQKLQKQIADWLKSIKERVQPKQEWSEEDEKGLGDALWAIQQASTIAKDENDMGNLWYAERWLKSLRPQSQWKPSEEQMEELSVAKDSCFDLSYKTKDALKSLYQDLKKLKG